MEIGIKLRGFLAGWLFSFVRKYFLSDKKKTKKQQHCIQNLFLTGRLLLGIPKVSLAFILKKLYFLPYITKIIP